MDEQTFLKMTPEDVVNQVSCIFIVVFYFLVSCFYKSVVSTC